MTSISRRTQILKIHTDKTGGFSKLKIGLVDSKYMPDYKISLHVSFNSCVRVQFTAAVDCTVFLKAAKRLSG